MFLLLSFSLFFFFNQDSLAQAKVPIALVYKGDGSCVEFPAENGCSESAARLAVKAGFKPIFIEPNQKIDASLFRKASVWIQPGGRVRQQNISMSKTLKSAIVKFVRDGGGYVGFCAGAFLATEKFGWLTSKGDFSATGLGILPGKSKLITEYNEEITESNPSKIVPTFWNGNLRSLYWELGPYFDSSSVNQSTEVVGEYSFSNANARRVMALKSTFGSGRIYVTGSHPEAPVSWRTYYSLNDPDGLDYDLGVEMISWAAKR